MTASAENTPWRSPTLNRAGAVLDDARGVPWHYGDPNGEQRALLARTAVVDCSWLGVVAVTGPDRLSWLHSLTTAHLTDLQPGQSTELLVLSARGHVQHQVGAVDDGTTTWLISETASELAVWLDSMRFMLRVSVADVTAQWAAIGEVASASGTHNGNAPDADDHHADDRRDDGPDHHADDHHADDHHADGPDRPMVEAQPSIMWTDPWPNTASGGTRYGPQDDVHPGQGRPWQLTLVSRPELDAELGRRERAGKKLAGTWASEALRVAAWRPAAAEIDHRTIPHELDLLRTAVHLRKGCYRGQETVARVHNLGRPPRRLVFLHLDGSQDTLPAAGAVVTDRDGVAVGAVTSAVRHYELGPIALAMVRRGLDVAAELMVETEYGSVAAAQELIVGVDGVTAQRPAGHRNLGLSVRRPPK